MSGTTAGGAPSAGWFPDPAGSPHLRWWDGGSWTDNFIDPVSGTPVSAGPPERQPPVHVLDDHAPIGRRQLRESASAQEAGHAEPAEMAPFAPLVAGPGGPAPWVSAPPPKIEDAYPIQAEPTYVPMSRSEPRRPPVQQVYVGGAQTPAGWMFALLPLLQLGLILGVYLQFASSVTGVVHVVLLAFPVPIYLLLAVLDRTRLVQNGHARAPSAAFAIIPPIYLARRVARVGVRALAAFLAWVLAESVAILLLFVMFPAVLTALTTFSFGASPAAIPQPTPTTAHVLTPSERAYQLTPAGMAATLKSSFATQGINLLSVTCPPLASTEDGQTVTCTGALEISNLAITVSVANEFPTAAFDVTNAVPAQ